MNVVLQICAPCLGSSGNADIENLIKALSTSDIAKRATITTTHCGETCAAPAQLWLQSEDGASYIFEGIDLTADRDDILATLRTYLASPNGWIEDARPCGRLRFCLTARVPA